LLHFLDECTFVLSFVSFVVKKRMRINHKGHEGFHKGTQRLFREPHLLSESRVAVISNPSEGSHLPFFYYPFGG